MPEDTNNSGRSSSGRTGFNALADMVVSANNAAAAQYTEHLNAPNKFKINGADYYCYFEISKEEIPTNDIHPTKVDRTNKIRLTKSAIVNLDIQENLFEPFCSGSITINNPFDYVEDNHYTTGDGDDYLHMELCNWEEHALNPDVGLKYTFVITDESNSVSKTDRSNNFKTYKLLDKNYARLNERIPYGKKYPSTSDRSVGECIKQVLIDALGPDVIGPQWHNGSHNIGEANGQFPGLQQSISSPLNWRYSDLLKYLLQINYSLGGEGQALPVQCILYFDRSIQKYSLEPIDAIFKDNHVLAIEAFGLGDLTGNIDESAQAAIAGGRYGTNKNNPKDSKVPVNVNEGMLKNANVTTPMINYGDEFFVDLSTGFYDQQTGAGGQIQTSLEDVVPEWRKAFVDVFKLVGGVPEPFVPYNKIRGRTVKTMVCPFEKDQIQNIAKAQLVSNLTFLNLQLTIDNSGNTSRRPGTFIDLFKLTESKEGVSFSDGKVLGRWFVTKVHHRFFKDSYQNVIQCVKTYVGPDMPESEIPPPSSVQEAETQPLPWTGEVDPSYMPPPDQLAGAVSASGYEPTVYATAYEGGTPENPRGTGRILDLTTQQEIYATPAERDAILASDNPWIRRTPLPVRNQFIGNAENRLVAGRSVAVDAVDGRRWPRGTILRINGREYEVADRAAMVTRNRTGRGVIDFYAGNSREMRDQFRNMRIETIEVVSTPGA